MKTQTIVLAVLAAGSIGVANAGDVTGLTSFTSGSKAVASEVNGNFNAVKTAVDDNNSRIATLQPEHVAYVSPSGGNYADPVAAMADLAKWCGTPSATNLCLLKIMPGVYDLGTTSLQMHSYVDIEGSGENVTHVTSNVGPNTGVVVGVDAAELRDLTVEHTGVSGYATAIFVNGVSYNGAFSLRRITARIRGAGIFQGFGVYTFNVNFKASDLTVRINGGGNDLYSQGVYISGSATADMENVDVRVGLVGDGQLAGILVDGPIYAKVRNSSVSATRALDARNNAYLEVAYTTVRGDRG